MVFNLVMWFINLIEVEILLAQEEKAKVIQTLLFVAGINTFFQTLFGTRLPAVIGGSCTFVPTTISIILAGRYSDIVNPQEVGSLHILWRFCCVTILVNLDSDKYAEIREDNARNTGCAYCCFNPPNCCWLQWPLAQCREVGSCLDT